MSYDSTVDELQLSYQGGSAPSIRKPIMSYDSTVDELQLSYQGGNDPSIENPFCFMTQLSMNYNWVTKVEMIHPLETRSELWLNCRWTTTELPKFHLPPW